MNAIENPTLQRRFAWSFSKYADLSNIGCFGAHLDAKWDRWRHLEFNYMRFLQIIYRLMIQDQLFIEHLAR